MLDYVAMLPVLIMLKNLLAYCIVENFRGKKLLGIMIFAEKTFTVCSLVLQMDTKPQKFLKKTIANQMCSVGFSSQIELTAMDLYRYLLTLSFQ